MTAHDREHNSPDSCQRDCCHCRPKRDRLIPGTLTFRDPEERYETRVRAARLLKRIAEGKGQAVPIDVAADAARRLPGE